MNYLLEFSQYQWKSVQLGESHPLDSSARFNKPDLKKLYLRYIYIANTIEALHTVAYVKTNNSKKVNDSNIPSSQYALSYKKQNIIQKNPAINKMQPPEGWCETSLVVAKKWL